MTTPQHMSIIIQGSLGGICTTTLCKQMRSYFDTSNPEAGWNAVEDLTLVTCKNCLKRVHTRYGQHLLELNRNHKTIIKMRRAGL